MLRPGDAGTLCPEASASTLFQCARRCDSGAPALPNKALPLTIAVGTLGDGAGSRNVRANGLGAPYLQTSDNRISWSDRTLPCLLRVPADVRPSGGQFDR
jgi:hypothetical protein